MAPFLVALDARPLSNPHAGGFRSYVRALLAGLCERATAGERVPRLLLYLDRPLTEGASRIVPPGTETRILSPDRLQTDWRLWREQVRTDRPDLVFGTQNYLPNSSSVPTAVVVHDAMGIKRYSWDRHTPRTFRDRLINRYWHYRTLVSSRRASKIITVSRGARTEIRSVLTDLPESRFVLVYNGIVIPPSRHVGPRDSGTLLCVASPDRRKNLDLLYDALANCKDRFGKVAPALRIVCTSDTTARRTEAILSRYNLPAELLTGLDDQSLSDEYARATVFVWPSRQEGFGLPPLEMMRTGGAVISSDAPCMPEVLGDIPLYFPPHDAAALADAAGRFLASPELRRERGERGRTHAETFTCRRMADETIAVWEQAARTV